MAYLYDSSNQFILITKDLSFFYIEYCWAGDLYFLKNRIACMRVLEPYLAYKLVIDFFPPSNSYVTDIPLQGY